MNVVFDFGGVLFEWQPHEFLARLLPQRTSSPLAARALATDFFQGFGGDWARFDRGTVEPDELAEAIARRTGLTLHEVRAVIEAVPQELRPVPGTLALLRRLHAGGHALFFLSNMPEPYAQHLETSHDFLGPFSGGVFSSRVKLIKPDPQIFALAARSFGIAAADTIFIDDIAHNAETARAAGWRAIHFRDPAQCEHELVQCGLL